MPQKLEATSLCIELSQELGEYEHSQEFLCGRALPFLLWEAEAWRWEGPELLFSQSVGFFSLPGSSLQVIFTPSLSHPGFWMPHPGASHSILQHPTEHHQHRGCELCSPPRHEQGSGAGPGNSLGFWALLVPSCCRLSVSPQRWDRGCDLHFWSLQEVSPSRYTGKLCLAENSFSGGFAPSFPIWLA